MCTLVDCICNVRVSGFSISQLVLGVNPLNFDGTTGDMGRK